MAQTHNMIPKRSALQNVKRGVLETPIRALVYGAEKVGKSTMAAGAPSPIFLGAENGTERLDVHRLEPKEWTEAIDWLDELAREKHEYKTLVVDPLNWLEPMCWAQVCKVDGAESIEKACGGYGKGYTAALDLWRYFLVRLDNCWRKGMHVILVAHSHVKTFQNPEGAPYDRYEIAMNAKAAALFKQWVDAVLFARLETFAKMEKNATKAKGYSSGARVMHTQPAAAYDAGARWKLPEEIPLSWQDFTDAVARESVRGPELLKQIDALLGDLNDTEVTAATRPWVERNKGSADRLAEMVNRLSKKLDEKKAKES